MHAKPSPPLCATGFGSTERHPWFMTAHAARSRYDHITHCTKYLHECEPVRLAGAMYVPWGSASEIGWCLQRSGPWTARYAP